MEMKEHLNVRHCRCRGCDEIFNHGKRDKLSYNNIMKVRKFLHKGQPQQHWHTNMQPSIQDCLFTIESFIDNARGAK